LSEVTQDGFLPEILSIYLTWNRSWTHRTSLDYSIQNLCFNKVGRNLIL